MKSRRVGYLAVGPGWVGSKDFIAGKFWPEDNLYIDAEPDLPLHQLFRKEGVATTKGASGLLSWTVMKAVAKGRAKTDPSKSGGVQWNLGGTFVVDTETGVVLFEHRQKGFADHPSIAGVLAACDHAGVYEDFKSEGKSAGL